MRSMVEEALWTMQAFPSYMPRFCEGDADHITDSGLWQLLRIRDAYSAQNPRYASGRVLVRRNTCGFQTRCA